MLCNLEATIHPIGDDAGGPKSARPDRRSHPTVQTALRLFLDARQHADAQGVDPWQFAVELAACRDSGVTINDLRWLLSQGYVAHAVELTQIAQERREFRPVGNLMLPGRTCFVLTPAGADWARAELADAAALPMSVGLVPEWDPLRRELRLGGELVKQFRQPAPSQETVIAAFAEDGWPAHIDDPLPQALGRDPKRHLHDTINNLNRNQRRPLIRFRGDGSGQGIYWGVRIEK